MGKQKHQEIKKHIQPSNCTPRNIPDRNENISSHKSVYRNVHSSIIHQSQKWKQPGCPSTDELISTTWYICPLEYYAAMKSMKFGRMLPHDEPWKHDAKWKKPDTKGQILYDSTCMNPPVVQPLWETIWRFLHLYNLPLTWNLQKGD